MKAHTIPASYLAGFAAGNGPPRRRELTVILRTKVLERRAVESVCVSNSYYTSDSKADGALFAEQEKYFGSLLDRISRRELSWIADIARHLILLRFRARSAMETTNNRLGLVALIKSIQLPFGQAQALRLAKDAPDLVTSDCPVICVGNSGRHPERNDTLGSIDALLLPVSPRILVAWIGIPGAYLLTDKLVSAEDALLLNARQAENATECVIARTRPKDAIALQKLMTPPSFPGSYVAEHPTHRHILSWNSTVPRLFEQLTFVQKDAKWRKLNLGDLGIAKEKGA